MTANLLANWKFKYPKNPSPIVTRIGMSATEGKRDDCERPRKATPHEWLSVLANNTHDSCTPFEHIRVLHVKLQRNLRKPKEMPGMLSN